MLRTTEPILGTKIYGGSYKSISIRDWCFAYINWGQSAIQRVSRKVFREFANSNIWWDNLADRTWLREESYVYRTSGALRSTPTGSYVSTWFSINIWPRWGHSILQSYYKRNISPLLGYFYITQKWSRENRSFFCDLCATLRDLCDTKTGESSE